MKILSKSIAASTLFFALSAPALAAISQCDIERDVRNAAGSSSNVRVSVNGDTVTLTGFVEDSFSLQRIAVAARKGGATKVNNLVQRSR